MEKGLMEKRRVIEAKQAERCVEKEPILARCPECGESGGVMEGRYQNYQYSECGLTNVVLLDVLVFNCKCGAIVPEIPYTAALHRFIAMELLRKPTLLCGEEVRFLRKLIGYSSVQLAELIAVSNVTLSRWENEAVRINRNADRILRLVFFAAIMEADARLIHGIAENKECVSQLAALAKKVETFDLIALLRNIRAVHERHLIRVDPARLAEFGRNEAAIRGEAATQMVQ
jgi:DNA-binding transcriptional regulator YiaG